MYPSTLEKLQMYSPPVPLLAVLEPQRSQRNILFSFAAEMAANEKKSASGGSMIADL
jgi:hypothetical protein